MYSFRHTFITKLYRELPKNHSQFETKSTLMLITGHSTMTALDKYLRDIDAELPEDYSDLLKWIHIYMFNDGNYKISVKDTDNVKYIISN